MSAWIDGLPGPAVEKWIADHGEEACKVHMTDDPHFALWLHYLDRSCRRRTWLSYQDLEDWDYWSAYDAGMAPHEACVEMLEYNGYGEI